MDLPSSQFRTVAGETPTSSANFRRSQFKPSFLSARMSLPSIFFLSGVKWEILSTIRKRGPVPERRDDLWVRPPDLSMRMNHTKNHREVSFSPGVQQNRGEDFWWPLSRRRRGARPIRGERFLRKIHLVELGIGIQGGEDTGDVNNVGFALDSISPMVSAEITAEIFVNMARQEDVDGRVQQVLAG